MRILNLIPFLSGGGAERQLSYLAPAMTEVGHEVHIAFLNDGPEGIPLPGVRLHRIVVAGNYDLRLILKLWFLIQRIKPDIIQTWIGMMDILVGFLTYVSNSKWVLRESSSEIVYQTLKFKKNLRALLAQRASGIICNSIDGKNYWLKEGVPENRVFVIRNAVPADVLNGISPLASKNRDKKTLIYAGRLIPSKNVYVLIEAMTEVRRHQDAVLVIAGEGPAKSGLIREVTRSNLGGTVSFVGHLQPRELWAQMRAADLFVSLSTREGMPNCAMEAVACGVPVLLSDIPAHRAFLDDESARFVRGDSAAEAARSILQIIEHPENAAAKAARAREAIKGSTPAAIASEYIDVYMSVAR
jgi:glycosyltransferase involved in cell wall biosynthesis